ncbi:sigma-70 family RNA polymerase sigma factor [uncultured Nocardioides sp.]|uniref:RNA polymerase sigma factor n=1 Tax=uncultured Nocardioides sp. TaxID=198441 RepID=UPI002632412D|nr:sigma-70 family RNA polymerase sigma factor [uncultured Nocardioides sp.]
MAEHHPDDDARARFEQLAAEVVEPVRRFLARRTTHDTAEDVLAETLLVCWRRLDQVPEPALPWVYGVARNCLANAERGDRRQHRLAARISVVDPPSEEAPEPDPPDERVTEALAAMRTEEAELLRLWAWEQLGPSEIAEVLGITANAVSIRLHRARGKFVEELRKIDAVAGHETSREGRDT